MRRQIEARLSKLEVAASPLRRVIPMFAWGKTEAEIEAEQAEMIRRGVASTQDTFEVFTWIKSSGKLAGRPEGSSDA